MLFKDIYEVVEGVKCKSIQEMIKENHIDLIYDSLLVYNKESRFDGNHGYAAIFVKDGLDTLYEEFLILHELGHYFLHYITNELQFSYKVRNLHQEENDANTFACLYLVRNSIWNDEYFDTYLFTQSVPKKICDYVQNRIYQHKRNVKYNNYWDRLEC